VLAEQRARLARGDGRLSYGETSSYLTALKRQPELRWLGAVPSVPLQQALRHLDRAFLNWTAGRTTAPAFRRKRLRRNAAAFVGSAFRWDAHRRVLTLARFGDLRVRWSRPLPDGCSPSTVTITRDPGGRTFVSVLVDEPICARLPASRRTALDLGLSVWVTTSEGERVANPRCYARYLRQLKRAQRCLSRKRPGSRNRNKAQVRVGRLHVRIADARRDATHKLSTRIVSENQAIALETLNVAGMRRNHSLARSIADAAWAELARQITYKCAWYGRQLVRASPWFPSSRLCSACGEKANELPLEIRSWRCGCGVRHDRDVNAAKNLLTLLAEQTHSNPAVGHTGAACGGPTRPLRRRGPRKQEDSGAIRVGNPPRESGPEAVKF
jgi:putative transposase